VTLQFVRTIEYCCGDWPRKKNQRVIHADFSLKKCMGRVFPRIQGTAFAP
jgi:hypothetical protein